MSILCNVFWRFDLILIPALDGEIRPSPLRTFRFPKCQLDECCSLDPSAALLKDGSSPTAVAVKPDQADALRPEFLQNRQAVYREAPIRFSR
jgi:hypothetical protein